jgi:DNA repair exonuclease SbcCD ATPase subunit
MITLKSIKWKNFLSTGNVFTEIQLNKHNNTLIVGENGAGKSTILDALTFALFGKPYRNINKPQLVNSINNKDCLVELIFSISDKEYLIRRGIKPNVFEIYVDGDLLNQSASSKDYQEILEKMIIKMNYKSFTQIVILGATSFTPFMQLSASDRRAVIEDLLDIQIFSNMNVIVKEKLTSLKDESNEIKIRLQNVKEKIDLHKSHLDEMKKNNQDMIERKQQEIANNNLLVTQTKSEISNTQVKITELLDTISDHNDMLKKNQKLTSLEAKIDANKGKLEKEISFYNDNDNCPTCKQIIDDNFKSSAITECNHKVSELNAGLEKLKEEQNAILQRLNNIAQTNKTLQTLESNITKHTSDLNNIRKYIIVLEREVEELTSNKVISGDTEEQSKKLFDELSSYIERRKIVTEEKQYYDIAAQLLKDGGIKSKIIKQYLPIINKLVNKYLAAMDFFVNFNMDEEFKETIKSRHRDDFSYENFSEGEKQKIDLALLLTWRSVARLKNSVNTNLLILDETFDSSLDAKGTDALLQILHTMPDNTNIFVISHKDQLHDKFTQAIRFEKKQNFSRMII